jgi:hypothetical protein
MMPVSLGLAAGVAGALVLGGTVASLLYEYGHAIRSCSPRCSVSWQPWA